MTNETLPLLVSASDLAAWRRRQSAPLHFVPTMGALHRGHQQLIRSAAAPRGGERPIVLVSAFVNPLQFGAGEDFDRYPRQLARDRQLAAAAGATALWAPAVETIYPDGAEAVTRVLPPQSLTSGLCGASRPGHFEGVATVVVRLLALVAPDRLFLGEKDWQQLVVLRRVLNDLGLPASIEACATVRDGDGLACSSRNHYLSADDRARAVALPAALAAAARCAAQGERRTAALVELVRQQLAAAQLQPVYVEVVAAHTLMPLQQLSGLAVVAAAVQCGPARLIDHVFVMTRAPIVAIDGPAGAGKSTVTRALARRLGLLYLDTGAMYRAVTWLVMHSGVDPSDPAAIAPLLPALDLRLSTDACGGGQQVSVNGQDVSEAIRSPELTERVSLVAAHPCVREALTAQQQAMGQRGGLVAEGRDIGTAVFPDADLKVFLTASVAERARRRALDLQQRGFAAPVLDELEAQIAARDQLDSTRVVAPLTQAADALPLITDGLSVEAVIERLVELFRQRIPHDAWPDPA